MKKIALLVSLCLFMSVLIFCGCTEEGPLDTAIWIRIKNEKNVSVNFTLTLDGDTFPPVTIEPETTYNLSDLDPEDYPQGIYHNAEFVFEWGGTPTYSTPGQFKYYCYQTLKAEGGFSGGLS